MRAPLAPCFEEVLVRFSYSALKQYGECPHRYRIERVEGHKAPPTRAMLVGSALHAAVAAYLRHLYSERLATDVTWIQPALEIAEDALRQERQALDGEGWEEAMELLAEYVTSHAFEPAAEAEIEKRLEVPVGDGGDTFIAIIDMLEIRDGQARVRDWKTSWAVPTQSEAQKDLQMYCYGWVVSRVYGCDEVYCELDYVRHGVTRGAVLGPEELARAEERILRAVDRIKREEEWAPAPGSHCAYCPWAADCPVAARPDGPDEDPRALAERILVLEAQLKRAKELLSMWCAEHGPVAVGGEVFGHLPPKSPSWAVTDKREYARILEGHGLDSSEFFRVDAVKLRQLNSRKWAHVWADLEPLLRPEVKVTFTHRRAGEGS